MSVSSVRIQPSNTPWTLPEVQLRLLLSCPYENELLKRLPAALTTIVCAYANENLGSNTYNWYNVLRKLNILPETIPPLPLNIHEILASTCPIFGAPRRLTDTHSLWLIPGGAKTPDIDTLAKHCGERIETRLLGRKQAGVKDKEIVLRTSETVGFEAPVWIMISDLLPKSVDRSYCIQEELITKLRKDSFANYEIPSLKYALAASLLKIQTDGSGLWWQDGTNKSTRVLENVLYYYDRYFNSALNCTITVGSSRDQYGRTVGRISYCQQGKGAPMYWDENVGIAALWVNFRPKTEFSCVLS